MKQTHPFSKSQLNGRAKEYAVKMIDRVRNHRIAGNDFENKKEDRWDVHILSVACASDVPPYISESGHNCTTLKMCHPTLGAALPCRLGEKPRLTEDEKNGMVHISGNSYPAGHCAEPHAAQKLLNSVDKAGGGIAIENISFGDALHVDNGQPEKYCRTCQLTFPQLRY